MKEIFNFDQIAPLRVRLFNPKTVNYLTDVGLEAREVGITDMGQAVNYLNERVTGSSNVEVNRTEAAKLAICGILVNTAIYYHGTFRTEIDGRKLVTKSQGSRQEYLKIVEDYQKLRDEIYKQSKTNLLGDTLHPF